MPPYEGRKQISLNKEDTWSVSQIRWLPSRPLPSLFLCGSPRPLDCLRVHPVRKTGLPARTEERVLFLRRKKRVRRLLLLRHLDGQQGFIVRDLFKMQPGLLKDGM